MADYTTAVQGFRINKDAGLNLSTDYVDDRNSKIIQGDNFENFKKEKKVMTALTLLKKDQQGKQNPTKSISY